MAVNLRTTSFPNVNNATGKQSLTLPTNSVVNDLLLLLVVQTNDVAFTPPGNFILVPGAQITGTFKTQVYQRIVTSDEPESYWMDCESGTYSAVLMAIDSTTLTYPQVHQVATASSNSANTNKTWNGVTNTDANTLLLCFGGFGTNAVSTPDAAMTERLDSNSPHFYLMSQTVAATGATGTRTATGSSVASQRCITISITESNSSGIIYPDQTQVTEFGVMTELDPNHSIYVNEFFTFAEIGAKGIYNSQYGIFVEVAAQGIYVTQFGVFIEMEEQGDGIIIIGNTKSWHDIYPKIVTDIPLVQAYNFILTTNGLYMLELSWDDVDDEDGYEIERSPNGTTDWTLIHTVDPDVTNYISVSLYPNTTYYYRIRSFNGGGYSAYSSVVSETTMKIGPSLIGKTHIANITYNPIIIPKPEEVSTGDYMLMQVGVQDIDTIIVPDGWILEDTIPGDYYNLIYSRVATNSEPE